MKKIYEFSIIRISWFVKKNLLIMLFAVFICIGVSISAYLGSDVTGSDNTWSVSITHAPSTPTPTLGPDAGWWTTVVTPTPK